MASLSKVGKPEAENDCYWYTRLGVECGTKMAKLSIWWPKKDAILGKIR